MLDSDKDFKRLGETYVLFIQIGNAETVGVGRLGVIDLLPGSYIYIGSAKGCLEKRMNRHLRKDKKLFWHIDYILNQNVSSEIKEIWTHDNSNECWLTHQLERFCWAHPVKKGFGSSDCHCWTHFFSIDKIYHIQKRLSALNFSLYWLHA